MGLEQLMEDPVISENAMNDYEPDEPMPLPVAPPQQEPMPLAVALPEQEIDIDNNHFIVCRRCLINRARVIFSRCKQSDLIFCLRCHQEHNRRREPNNILLCPECNSDCRDFIEVIH